jgi:serine/threonine-protein kinase Chk1
MSAVGYMHGKGVSHRDLKPENILVGESGDLKLADFGLAALFKRGGEVRLCNTVCGSPPYIAPEVVNGKRTKRYDVLEHGYAPHVADIWSCGVILFTLLVGNTPWDEPTERSYEFKEYVNSGGKMGDELWQQLPKDTLSLLRGMLKLEPSKRFTLDEIRSHPWMRRTNPIMDTNGRAKDPIALATQMMESLRVKFEPSASSQRQSERLASSDTMDIEYDVLDLGRGIAATQPETPLNDIAFDWERPMSQPVRSRASTQPPRELVDQLMEDPALSQFTQTPAVPLSLTQIARRFGDIVPATPLTQFLSALPPDLLISTVIEALAKLRVPATPLESTDAVYIRIKARDGRGQSLNGNAIISQWNSEIFEVRFVKLKGDPLEWRRFFKNICAYCKDAIIRPDQL